jgi:hypothetical protein
MKNRKLYLIVLLILIFGLAGWWYWQAKTKPPATPLKARPSAVAKSPASNPSPAVTPSLNQTPAATPPPPAYGAPPIAATRDPFANADPAAMAALQNAVANDDSKEEIMQAAWAAANSKTLTLYGKVVDQSGDPVVGANVRGGTLLIGGAERSGSEPFQTQTDGQGRFNVSAHGVDIGVTLQKDGYDYDQKLSAQRPEGYLNSDPDHPVVFTIWKAQGAEPMVHQNFHFLIACDGTPTSVNLQTGKSVTSGGDMVITFTRNPVQIVRGKPFDWTLTLEVPDGGGLVEMHDAYPYEAPADGYKPSITVGTGSNQQSFPDSDEQVYYFKSAGGKYYGRIRIKLQPDFQPPPTFLQIEAYLNPSGSRNLEFDSAKTIKSK